MASEARFGTDYKDRADGESRIEDSFLSRETRESQ